MADFDHIFIGSSPLSLMCHNKLNKSSSSLILEQFERLGGAWYTSSLWGIENMEMGCHFLLNDETGYQLMKEAGVRLERMEVQPHLLLASMSGESTLNYLKNFALKTRLSLKSRKLLDKYKVQKIENSIKGKSTEPFQYRAGGCYEMIRDLSENKEGIRTKTRIEKLNVQDDQVILDLESGESISTSCLHIPRNYYAGEIVVKNESITPIYTEYVSEHYIIKYPKQDSTFAFIECIGDELLNLISNVGRFANYADHLVIAVAVKKVGSRSENNLTVSRADALPNVEQQKEIVKEITTKLKKFNIIRSDSEILDYHYEPYFLKTKANDGEIKELLSTSKNIDLVDTTDLITSIINSPILNEA